VQHYDYIIAGGGGAGLSLLCHLLDYPSLKDKKILLLDRELKQHNDRTWCFWTPEPTLYESVICKTWKKLSFLGTGEYHFDLGRMSYQMLRGKDFYRFAYAQIAASPQVTCHFSGVKGIVQEGDKAWVTTEDGQVFQGGMVFDSRFDAANFKPAKGNPIFLWQHFKGWHVKTPNARFDPQTIQMFDFKMPQEGQVRFVYILPVSEYEALIEYTIFSKEVFSEEAAYDNVLSDYVSVKLGIEEYEIAEVEKGIIPMTDMPCPLQQSPLVYNIGTRAGMCRGSTGYAFMRMQRDSAYIANKLAKGLSIGKERGMPMRFKLYDSVIMQLMEQQGHKIADYFEDIFRKNPIDLVLRFLDEQTTPAEDLRVMASVPSWPFMLSTFKVMARQV
jgi:lycopene beta-cyclase